MSSDACITSEERGEMIEMLEDSEREFLEKVEHLTDEQWAYKPAEDRWAVGEIAEHILIVEQRLFGAMEQALAAPPDPQWRTKTEGKKEFLERVMPVPLNKAQAPDSARPTHQMSRAELMARLKETRQKTIRFVEETELPLKAHTLEHRFPVFGWLNAYQWLLYVPLHNRRHSHQIAEVISTAGFPHPI